MTQFQFGNKEAEKRTEKATEEFWIKAKTVLEKNKQVYSLAKVASELGTYKEIFSTLLKKFPRFSSYKDRIDNEIEVRVHEGAITGKIKETTSIFTLKNNHGRKDKHETEVSGNITIDTVLGEIIK